MLLFIKKHYFILILLLAYFQSTQANNAKIASAILASPLTANQDFVIPVTANDDLIRMDKATTYDINVLQNDLGLTSGIKSLRITLQPKYGKAEFREDHRLYYTPDPYFIGEDSLMYEVCNNGGSCAQAGVGIIVRDFDYQPEAVDDHLEILQGRLATVDVLDNDLFLFDLDINLEIVSHPKYGTASVTNQQTISYVSYEFFTGRDSLIYKVCDGDNDCDTGYLWVTLSNKFDNSAIPQGFSPNGDGINDVFNIPAFDQYTPLKIMIMDRNGQLVYTSDTYNNQWDGVSNSGNYNGLPVPSGVYYYKLTAPEIEQEVVGYIYLNR